MADSERVVELAKRYREELLDLATVRAWVVATGFPPAIEAKVLAAFDAHEAALSVVARSNLDALS